MDRVEDEGEEYRRVVVPVELDDGERAFACAYEHLGTVDGRPEVDGTWPAGRPAVWEWPRREP